MPAKLIAVTLAIWTYCTYAHAWDPIGDLRDPGRIARNVQRETTRAVQDIPNIPRNVERETRRGIEDIPNVPRNFGREVDNFGRELDRIRLEVQAQAAAPILENWLRASRNSAISTASPIPPHIRYQLEGTYDADILNRARYKIGDNGAFNIAGLSIQYGDSVNAVTLIDVIVFSDLAGANDPALWAHELKHVEQYRDWGVRDFAIRYIRSWNGVENPAYTAQNSFRFRNVAQYAPPSGMPSFGQRCSTLYGICLMFQPSPVGQGCFCSGPPQANGQVIP